MRSACLILALLASVAAVHAAPNEAQRRRDAKQHFEKGRSAYGAGDADTAIREYQAAYELLPFPDFVFNLAQAHRLKQNYEEAIRHYRLYLTLDPRGEAAESARGSIDELTAKLVQQRESESQRAAEARQRQEAQAEEEAQRAAATRAPRSSPAPLAVVEPALQVPSRGRALRVAGVAIGAVGLGGLVLGAGFVGGAAAAHDDFFHPADGKYSAGADDRQRTFETLDVAFFAIGGVALATGVILYLAGRHEARR